MAGEPFLLVSYNAAYEYVLIDAYIFYSASDLSVFEEACYLQGQDTIAAAQRHQERAIESGRKVWEEQDTLIANGLDRLASLKRRRAIYEALPENRAAKKTA